MLGSRVLGQGTQTRSHQCLELPLSAMDATLLRQLARSPKDHLRRVVLIDVPAALAEHLGELATYLRCEDSQPQRLRLRDGRWLV